MIVTALSGDLNSLAAYNFTLFKSQTKNNWELVVDWPTTLHAKYLINNKLPIVSIRYGEALQAKKFPQDHKIYAWDIPIDQVEHNKKQTKNYINA